MTRELAIVAVLLASACTGPPPTVSASSAAPAPASPVPTSVTAVTSPPGLAPTPTPLTFHISASQTRIVATLIAFLDAYNAGHMDTALAMLTPDVVTSDCDYRGVHVTTANRTEAVREWLRERADDHDQLVLESIANENPDPASGSHVVAVTYSRRTSDTLRALGFPNGITPQLASKVVFTATDDRIRAFANGPFGGDPQLCRPSL